MAETIVSSIPALHAFDPRTTTWQSYRDRIGFYFKANRIMEDSDKKALLLWSIGDSTYNLLESLMSPTALTDTTITFETLTKVLDSHYDIRKNIMTSTYDFYSCVQKPGQSFIEWKAELCEKLRHCGFTTSKLAKKPQDRALRDMYVIGIRSQKTRQALLKEEDPDLEATEKIIQMAERLQEDVRHFNANTGQTDGNVAKIDRQQSSGTPRQQTRSHNKQDKKPCTVCGSSQHVRGTCKYRKYTCNFCKRVGHLERVCRQKKDPKQTTKHITTVYKVNNTNQYNKNRNNSLNVKLLVNNYEMEFEMDTGSTHTIISENDWKNIGSPAIQATKHKLQCYSGNLLKLLGECEVSINYKNQKLSLPLIVIHSNGLAERFVRSFKEGLAKERLSGQLNKNIAVRNIMRTYRWSIHTSTGRSPADMMLQYPIRTALHRMKPLKHGSKQQRMSKYQVGQMVLTKINQPNASHIWKSGMVTKQLGSVLYEIQLPDGIVKRHQNQLRLQYGTANQQPDTTSLPDDMLNQNLFTEAQSTTQPTASRYPSRNRRPPDRYTPT
ncbi:unnamed protein product [Adineta ricciae]|uniref:Peptidase A2 domain-containing protein n=1 Tax=Adineta ricciae TaxID=249248 RepID=A0A814YAB7_ADIRI|nr:unnamed protein product [Adineta ricciae]CAF1226797.1 unnamed protein product [Adineta ricciae]